MKKRSFIINTLNKKCPKCQEGDLFNTPFEFSKPVDMPKNCPVCGQRFEPEPGFYYGAMFLSYIISAFFFLGVIGACIIFLGMSLNASFGVLLLVAAATYFFFLRISRSLWINIMVSYDSKARENYKETSFGD